MGPRAWRRGGGSHRAAGDARWDQPATAANPTKPATRNLNRIRFIAPLPVLMSVSIYIYSRVVRSIQQLGDIQYLHVPLALSALDTIIQHSHTKGTGDTHNIRSAFESVLGTLVIDTLITLLFNPHQPSAGPTTKTPLAILLHFHQLRARDRPDDFPRLLIGIVITA